MYFYYHLKHDFLRSDRIIGRQTVRFSLLKKAKPKIYFKKEIAFKKSETKNILQKRDRF
jgi:hypothetical protein